MMKTGWVFPAFVSEYIGTETSILDSLSSDFDHLLRLGSEVLGTDLTGFDPLHNNFMEHELMNQCMSYIFSCSVSNLLGKRGVRPDYISGLSMGIYAALYTGGSISFENGIRCIGQAFDLSASRLEGFEFGMAAIIGLSREDLEKIIQTTGKEVEIVNSNGIHSFVISGFYSRVEQVTLLAGNEGAFHAGMMNVTSPYHSKYMKVTAENFRSFLSALEIHSSRIPLVSTINQSLFQDRREIIRELTRNLDSEINWYMTMRKLIDLGTKIIIECGAGKSLYKIGKFIDGNFRIIPINRLVKFLEENS